MKKERIWSELQSFYDDGNSWAIVANKFSISNRSIRTAIAEGLLRTRTQTDSLLITLRKKGQIIREDLNCIECTKILSGKSKKFCGSDCQSAYKWRTDTVPSIIAGTAGVWPVKKYLIRTFGKCSDCGIGTEWNGKSLSLHIDHINGDSDDNRLENVRLLCPNCHSQTDNFGIKNKGQDSRRNRHMKLHRTKHER